jgi:hypothetical protein
MLTQPPPAAPVARQQGVKFCGHFVAGACVVVAVVCVGVAVVCVVVAFVLLFTVWPARCVTAACA